MRIFFLGGIGHCAARLEAARAVCDFEIKDIAYPGFEDRPRARTLDAFLDAVSARIQGDGIIYATGIGGLIALCLRSEGKLTARRIILQGALLWGRSFSPWRPSPFRPHGRRHFDRLPPPAYRDGYRSCSATPDLRRWLSPKLRKTLEQRFKSLPDSLGRIEAWWGGKDRVVGLRELQRTQMILHTAWPLRFFPAWGHYPMMDDPQRWCEVLAAALAP